MSIEIRQNGLKLATDWENVRLSMFETPVVGIKGVSYSSSQDKQNNYAAGNEVHSVSRANKNYEGSLTLTGMAAQELHNSLPPGASIEDIEPFDIIVEFRRLGQAEIETVILYAVEFTGRGRSMSQNDMDIPEELPLRVTKVFYSVEQMVAFLGGGLTT